MAINVTTKVPIPETARSRMRGREQLYPWDKMTKVGHSFFVPCTGKWTPERLRTNLITIGKGFVLRRYLPWQFCGRIWKEPDGTIGVRIWRIL